MATPIAKKSLPIKEAVDIKKKFYQITQIRTEVYPASEVTDTCVRN